MGGEVAGAYAVMEGVLDAFRDPVVAENERSVAPHRNDTLLVDTPLISPGVDREPDVLRPHRSRGTHGRVPEGFQPYRSRAIP